MTVGKPRTDMLVAHVGTDVADAVRQLAREKGVTISSIVRQALLTELAREGEDRGRDE